MEPCGCGTFTAEALERRAMLHRRWKVEQRIDYTANTDAGKEFVLRMIVTENFKKKERKKNAGKGLSFTYRRCIGAGGGW